MNLGGKPLRFILPHVKQLLKIFFGLSQINFKLGLLFLLTHPFEGPVLEDTNTRDFLG